MKILDFSAVTYPLYEEFGIEHSKQGPDIQIWVYPCNLKHTFYYIPNYAFIAAYITVKSLPTFWCNLLRAFHYTFCTNVPPTAHIGKLNREYLWCMDKKSYECNATNIIHIYGLLPTSTGIDAGASKGKSWPGYSWQQSGSMHKNVGCWFHQYSLPLSFVND